MGKYISIYRPINMAFIAIAQWLCAYFLNSKAQHSWITDGGIYWLMCGTAACAAFGYWVNDLLDRRRDFINGGTLSFIHRMDVTLVYIHLLIFILLALVCGNALGAWFVGLFIVTLLFLFLYSKWLKNIAVVGNVIIALLSFYSILSVYVLFRDIEPLLIIYFAMLAAGITLCREIIKDAEDIDGDRETGAKTLPIVGGLNTANITVYAIILFLIPIAVVTLYAQQSYFQGMLIYVYYTYCVLFIVMPLFKVAIDVRYASAKYEYTWLSLVLKYVFFTGILSILFF
jgi:4-hydroxybenzoate polyprenyltransferase